MVRINCISSPRNISTALMYSFAQRNDTCVVDEPFYAYYLQRTGKLHPGREEILASQPQEVDAVFDCLDQLGTSPVLYMKNMAKHLETIRTDRFKDFTHILLIRDPKQIITSFTKVYPSPKMEDLGIAYQHALYRFFIANDYRYIILDSNEVLKNPRGVLAQLCDRLSISFDTSMLSWKPGARPEDGVWAEHWYDGVHRSSGFIPPTLSDRHLPEQCTGLYEESRPHYDALYLHALKA